MDATDINIIKYLTKEGRATIKEIGQNVTLNWESPFRPWFLSTLILKSTMHSANSAMRKSPFCPCIISSDPTTRCS